MSAAAPANRVRRVPRQHAACGGQGVYLWFLARELARLGHSRSTCSWAPPTRTPCPSRARVTSCRTSSSGRAGSSATRAACCRAPEPLRIFEPLNFYELAVELDSASCPSPSPSACAWPSALPVRAGATPALATTSIHDVQCAGLRHCCGMRALGPAAVVSTIHHPLTIDRRFSPSRATENFMRHEGQPSPSTRSRTAGASWRGKSTGLITSSRGLCARSCSPTTSAWGRETHLHGGQRRRHRALPARTRKPAPRNPRSRSSSSWAAAGDREQGHSSTLVWARSLFCPPSRSP